MTAPISCPDQSQPLRIRGIHTWSQVGAAGREEQQVRSRVPDGLADGPALVAAEVVHHHDVARSERLGEDAFDVGVEDVAVHWSVEDPGGVDPVMAERLGVSGTLCIRRRSGSNLTALNHPAARSDPQTLWRTGLPRSAIL